MIDKNQSKFNAVRQLIYMQLDNFLKQQQLYEKMEMLLSQTVVATEEERKNTLTGIIFPKLVDALNLGINKYYHQSLVKLQEITHIDRQDFLYEIIGIAIAKTLKIFKSIGNSEERLIQRFLNYLAIKSVSELNDGLDHYWKQYVDKEGAPIFTSYEEGNEAEDDTSLATARKINEKIIKQYQQNEREDGVLCKDLLMETVYHNWIVGNGHLTKALYTHLIAVKSSLLLLKQMEQQEYVEVIVAFICQHTRGNNNRAVVAIIKSCCNNDNCFYQHQSRLKTKFKEGIEQHLTEQKGGGINYGCTRT